MKLALLLVATLLLAGCGNPVSNFGSGSNSSTASTDHIGTTTDGIPAGPIPTQLLPILPIRLNATGDAALRIGLAGGDCEVHVVTSFLTNGTEPSLAVIEERTGARFHYGPQGASIHAGSVDTRSRSGGDLQAHNTTVGVRDGDYVTIGVRDLTWWDNGFTGPFTLIVSTTCSGVTSLEVSRFVRMANLWTFQKGVGVDVPSAHLHAKDQWSFEMPQKVIIVGRNGQTAMVMRWETPEGSLEWRGGQLGEDYFLAAGLPGIYTATLESTGMGDLIVVAMGRMADEVPRPK